MKQVINQTYINQAGVYLSNADGEQILFAPIPKCLGYWAGVDGSIVSFKRNRYKVLKPHDNGIGRLQAGIYIDGKLKQRACQIFCVNGVSVVNGESIAELNGKTSQRRFPVADRHRPFLADVA